MNLIEAIQRRTRFQKTKKIRPFQGGVDLSGYDLAAHVDHSFSSIAVDRIRLDLPSAISSRIVVQEQELVAAGQLLQYDVLDDFPPVHSSISGVVRCIDHDRPSIEILGDGAGREAFLPPLNKPFNQPPEVLIRRIREAGIVGLGGAGFSASAKLTANGGTAVHTIIVNGSECEPLVCCDSALLTQHSKEVLAGACLLACSRGAKKVVAAVKKDDEAPLAKALAAFGELYDVSDIDIKIQEIPGIYPSGSERQITTMLFAEEIPSGHYPHHCGYLSFNVATCYAVWEAVYTGKPLIQRGISFVDVVRSRVSNHKVAVGTIVADLIAAIDLPREDDVLYLAGGTMMGSVVALNDAIGKNTHAVTRIPDQKAEEKHAPCIRCGYCASVCPARLLPQQLFYFAAADHHSRLAQSRLFDCIECGACAYVCPSRIPLVQYYRAAKDRIRAQQDEQHAAQHARWRYESREHRLARLRAEREQKIRQQRAQARQLLQRQAASQEDGATMRQKAIAKARERARKQIEERQR